ncbi:uncharacterized protein LOC102074390 isoform X2 [Zonotrichia albicollis]|uniref:uncharacterized protein LOC102074390 isoform X2 n=1 Tax=Zonotrichia albicollis TaxID=44394 RepID=UPI003D8120A5
MNYSHVHRALCIYSPKTPPVSGPATPCGNDEAQLLRGHECVSVCRHSLWDAGAGVGTQENKGGAAPGRTSAGRTHSRGSAAGCPSRSGTRPEAAGGREHSAGKRGRGEGVKGREERSVSAVELPAGSQGPAARAEVTAAGRKQARGAARCGRRLSEIHCWTYAFNS